MASVSFSRAFGAPAVSGRVTLAAVGLGSVALDSAVEAVTGAGVMVGAAAEGVIAPATDDVEATGAVAGAAAAATDDGDDDVSSTMRRGWESTDSLPVAAPDAEAAARLAGTAVGGIAADCACEAGKGTGRVCVAVSGERSALADAAEGVR